MVLNARTIFGQYPQDNVYNQDYILLFVLLIFFLLAVILYFVLFSYAKKRHWQSLVTVTSTLDRIEAHILKGRLEAEGIPAYIIGEHHTGVDWSVIVALGGVRVMVPEQFAWEATQILSQISNNHFHLSRTDTKFDEDPELLVEEKHYCPECSDSNITILSSGNRLLIPWLFLASIIPVSDMLGALYFILEIKTHASLLELTTNTNIHFYLASIIFALMALTYPKLYTNSQCSLCFHTWYMPSADSESPLQELIIMILKALALTILGFIVMWLVLYGVEHLVEKLTMRPIHY